MSQQVRKSSTSSVINRSNTESLSLAFLHKKRHSDSSIENNLPVNNTGSPNTPPLSTSNSTSSIPRLIRKKSGELVKSNLKLNCLVNNPGLSKSLPTTPSYNKNVHFGQDDVRYFNELDKPTAVSAHTSPILKGRNGRMRLGKLNKNQIFNSGYSIGGFDYDSIEESETSSDDDLYDDEWELQMVNFEKIKYNEKILTQKSKMFLERIVIDEEEEYITGYIAVKNLSFEKNIHVRYTFDNWRTVIEIEAFYVNEGTTPRILKRANYDRFKFKMNLRNFQFSLQNEISLLFCIRYRYGVGSTQEVWDNNDYKNYEILVKRTRQRRFNNSKFLLNDYVTGQTQFNSNFSNFDSSNSETKTISLDSLDSYFNNYEMLKSPETPKVLKNDNMDPVSPNFRLKKDDDEAIGPMNSLNLHTNDTTNTTTNKDTEQKTSTTSFKLNKHNKPRMNSKSYQELLDSYCFFKSDDSFAKSNGNSTTANNNLKNNSPTTISSYLDKTINRD